MIRQFQSISPRRKIVALAMAALIAIGGVASWAAVTDQLTVTNNYSVLSIDLQGSSDGTTYAATASLDWGLEGLTQVNRVLHLKNTGNSALKLQAGYISGATPVNGDIAWTATGAAAITGAAFNMRDITTASECPAQGTVSGTMWFSTSAPINTVGTRNFKTTANGQPNPNPEITIPANGTALICMTAKPSTAPAGTDTATQTVTFTARGGL